MENGNWGVGERNWGVKDSNMDRKLIIFLKMGKAVNLTVEKLEETTEANETDETIKGTS